MFVHHGTPCNPVQLLLHAKLETGKLEDTVESARNFIISTVYPPIVPVLLNMHEVTEYLAHKTTRKPGPYEFDDVQSYQREYRMEEQAKWKQSKTQLINQIKQDVCKEIGDFILELSHPETGLTKMCVVSAGVTRETSGEGPIEKESTPAEKHVADRLKIIALKVKWAIGAMFHKFWELCDDCMDPVLPKEPKSKGLLGTAAVVVATTSKSKFDEFCSGYMVKRSMHHAELCYQLTFKWTVERFQRDHHIYRGHRPVLYSDLIEVKSDVEKAFAATNAKFCPRDLPNLADHNYLDNRYREWHLEQKDHAHLAIVHLSVVCE